MRSAQSSLKRILAYSGVAQAGYLLAGVVVGTQLGAKATVFYLVVYAAMNIAAFSVVIARERASIVRRRDLLVRGPRPQTQPLLAWPLTIAFLGLAGIPATAGFIGKFYLIDALVSGDYAWLAIVLVIGSMISLGYYLKVIAAMWMGDAEKAAVAAAPAVAAPGTPPIMAGGSQEADGLVEKAQPELLFTAWLATAVVLFFGIIPQPLFELAEGRQAPGIF